MHKSVAPESPSTGVDKRQQLRVDCGGLPAQHNKSRGLGAGRSSAPPALPSLLLLVLLLLLPLCVDFTLAQPGCNPDAGCDAVLQCATGPLYCSPNVTLADAYVDFSGTQGRLGWFYGYRVTMFTQLSVFRNGSSSFGPDCTLNRWTNAIGLPVLCPSGGHPQQAPPTAAVRRFIAPTAMNVTISGSFANSQTDAIDPTCMSYPCDGTTAFIYLNGNVTTPLWTHNDTTRSGVLTNYSIRVTLQMGDILDFEIWPNSNSYCDYSVFTAHFNGPCASATCSNIRCSILGIPCVCVPPWIGPECALTPPPPPPPSPTTIAPSVLQVVQEQPLIVNGNLSIPLTLIVIVNHTFPIPIVVSGTVDLLDFPSLTVEITSSTLSDGAVIPIIQAGDIITGNFSSIEIRPTFQHERCSSSSMRGDLRQAETSVSVLLHVNGCKSRFSTWKVILIVTIPVLAGVGVAAWFGRRAVQRWKARTAAAINDHNAGPNLRGAQTNTIYSGARSSWSATSGPSPRSYANAP